MPGATPPGIPCMPATCMPPPSSAAALAAAAASFFALSWPGTTRHGPPFPPCLRPRTQSALRSHCPNGGGGPRYGRIGFIPMKPAGAIPAMPIIPIIAAIGIICCIAAICCATPAGDWSCCVICCSCCAIAGFCMSCC